MDTVSNALPSGRLRCFSPYPGIAVRHLHGQQIFILLKEDGLMLLQQNTDIV